MYDLRFTTLQPPVITLYTYKGLITKCKGSSSRDQKAKIAGLLSPTLQTIYSMACSKPILTVKVHASRKPKIYCALPPKRGNTKFNVQKKHFIF